MTTQKIRWGIAGLGAIANRFATDLVNSSQYGVLGAVAARQQQRAEDFADQYGCKVAYGSYEALASDSSIDAVYVATIHPAHLPLVALFLRHGKHVLVEKPAFICVEQWDAMAELAVNNGVILAEAMKSVAFPAYQQLCQFLIERQPEVTSIEAAFGGAHPYDPQLRIFDATLSGGATLDVGVYGLWLFADLCRVLGHPVPFPRTTITQTYPDLAVDQTVECLFEGAIQGRIGGSITEDLPRYAVIKGPELLITIAEKWWNPKRIDIEYQGQTYRLEPEVLGGGFEHEIDHLSTLILLRETQSPLLCHATSRKVIEIMEQLLKAHGFAHLVTPNPAS